MSATCDHIVSQSGGGWILTFGSYSDFIRFVGVAVSVFVALRDDRREAGVTDSFLRFLLVTGVAAGSGEASSLGLEGGLEKSLPASEGVGDSSLVSSSL
jgi:hypothetical protein